MIKLILLFLGLLALKYVWSGTSKDVSDAELQEKDQQVSGTIEAAEEHNPVLKKRTKLKKAKTDLKEIDAL